MSWAMVGAAAITVVGGYFSGKEANKGNQATIDEQRRQYDQSRQDQLPWLQAGTGALAQMQALNSGDFSSFKQSPDYQFSYDQGMQALDRSAAARGGLYAGGHSADLMKFGSGLAAQNYNTYYNRLQSLAGLGQTTGGNLQTLGQNVANNISNARQSTYNNNAQTYGATANALAGLYGQYMGQRNQGGYQGNPYGGYYAQPAYTSTGASWQNGYGG